MRVRMHSTYASPSGTCPAGGVIDLPADEARSLVAGRYAVEVDPLPPMPSPRTAPAVSDVESAAVEPDEVAATTPKKGRRRRG